MRRERRATPRAPELSKREEFRFLDHTPKAQDKRQRATVKVEDAIIWIAQARVGDLRAHVMAEAEALARRYCEIHLAEISERFPLND